ncbi:MAG: penicillin-binding protein 1A, partial [Spirochaetota bacterium]
MKKLKKIEIILIFTLLFLSIAFGTAMGILISAFENTTDISKLEQFKPEIPSKIYDRNGELISEIFTVKREPVTFKELPEELINAIIAIEDNKFYQHNGVDVTRVFGAVLVNLKTWSKAQGASTITMQLARTLFTGREKTYTRKIKELWLALKIEKRYSKNKIMTLYFNQIYFGHGAYGVEAASHFYFNKHVEDLNLAECALIAGLLQAPNRLSPLKNPELARQRQEKVLESMAKLGMVTAEEAYESFQDFWVNFRLQMRSPSQSVYKLAENKAPHFVEYVRQELFDLYGAEQVYTGGLKVYTSLDLEKQALAEKYLKQGLDEQNEVFKHIMAGIGKTLNSKILDSLDMLSMLFGLKKINLGAEKNRARMFERLSQDFIPPLDMLSLIFGTDEVNRIIQSSYQLKKRTGPFQKAEGALISIEPKTGYITAMVGGSGFSEDNQLNRAVQSSRQTGSGFKPYIYTAAIDTKMFTPASIIMDSPVVFYNGEEKWIPKNYGGKYHGKVRLREALRKSINVVTAKIVDRLGVDTVINNASKILQTPKERFPRVPSLALGVTELTPYEQARGFCTFANGGKAVTPISILYVLDRNGTLLDNFEARILKQQMEKGQEQIISEQTNYIMSDMLRDVMRPGGTGYWAANRVGFDRPAGGKTGTTQNWVDAWFTGFTPQLVTSVWVGYDRNNISLGKGRAGGIVAGPIWANYMKEALKDQPETWISRPKGVYSVNVCEKSGLLPTSDCDYTITEYFLEGTVPTRYCSECKPGTEDSTFNVELFKRSSSRKQPEPEEKESDTLMFETPESPEEFEQDIEMEGQIEQGERGARESIPVEEESTGGWSI